MIHRSCLLNSKYEMGGDVNERLLFTIFSRKITMRGIDD